MGKNHITFRRRLSSNRHRRFGGFTLIEILVVVVLIALIAALLLPTFLQSQSQARQTTCLSNLRNLGTAIQLYVQDNDERALPSVQTDVRTAGDEVLWCCYISPDHVHFDISGGLLYPYVKDTRVFDCPASVGLAGLNVNNGKPIYGYDVGYGINSATDISHPVTLSDVEQPAETILFADAAALNSSTGQQSRASVLWRPSDGIDDGYIQGRHNGLANVVWFDNHVQSVRVTTPDQSTGKATAQELQASHLGYLLKSGCPRNSPCQNYYYSVKKPPLN